MIMSHCKAVKAIMTLNKTGGAYNGQWNTMIIANNVKNDTQCTMYNVRVQTNNVQWI